MHRLIALAVVFAFTQSGCSKESFPTTVPVTGVVTLDGKAVAEATVNLVPMSQTGKSASGITDAEGKFSVTTYMSPTFSPAGAMPGEYVISVIKMQYPEKPPGMTQWEEQAWSDKAGKPKSLLPKTYLDPMKSGLKVTVKNAAEALKLELKD